MRHALVRLALLGALLTPMAALAADDPSLSPDANSPMPRCGPPTDGQVYCKFGIIYECRLIDANSMERRTGWRWTADILRGCNDPSPAGIDRQDAPPPSVIYAPDMTGRPGMHSRPDGSGATGETGAPPPGGTMHIRPGGIMPPNQ